MKLKLGLLLVSFFSTQAFATDKTKEEKAFYAFFMNTMCHYYGEHVPNLDTKILFDYKKEADFFKKFVSKKQRDRVNRDFESLVIEIYLDGGFEELGSEFFFTIPKIPSPFKYTPKNCRELASFNTLIKQQEKW
ncbi:hypothetical protein BST50_07405 [Vibrio vulnificus]|uniref:hypothetical protein n=1 Tax=Vibrio vulnificus TaxID=672 RepID=UPI000BA8863F|nr:hypothetical protein [Vibrio vulnificus]EIT7026559.1 hypothetical protein [Vibrio vulnificus]EIV8605962.1 hypothetical protein [Vibrio vulnificus]EJX1092004.1 hypothetical protein [Vibrio vulnificus]ELT7697370.1 hypothetical protein [Vibrio vulnificus]ELX4196949.1 hypothetical protein [Vibrio vulnificus]